MTVQRGRRLDWHGQYPSSNLPYTIDRWACFQQVTNHRNIRWTRKLWLNQQQTPGCTAWGGAHALSATPRSFTEIDDAKCLEWYRKNQQNDQWPGEDYEGSSVLGAMRTFKQEGRISSYHWCKTLAEIQHAVEWHGPMEWGTTWLTGMFYPDRDGFIHATGADEGGHAYCIAGINWPGSFFWLDQSWESTWGLNGSAKISFADTELLIGMRGEFSLPVKKVPVAV